MYFYLHSVICEEYVIIVINHNLTIQAIIHNFIITLKSNLHSTPTL